MYILAIESSCDETSIAILTLDGAVLTVQTASQIKDHQQFGGVVPEVASRQHEYYLLPLLSKALQQAGITQKELVAIAVTQGPGLQGSLMLGQMMAKSLSYILDIPLIGVNHLEGHLYANFIEHQPILPAIALIVSGGHTELYSIDSSFVITLKGKTKDDAVGEAFDKVARLLSLGYPGGPAIQKAAEKGNDTVKLPVSKLNGFDFSYSGLKTAVRVFVQKNPSVAKEDIARAFQKAAVEQLVEKTITLAVDENINTIYLAGGVAANSYLRSTLKVKAESLGNRVHMPSLNYCTDNAAMIGRAALYKYHKKKFSDSNLVASSTLSLATFK